MNQPHPFLINYPFREIVRAYPSGIIRLYCTFRAHILRERILKEIGQYVPTQGAVVELGCGFGLFANCLARSRPDAAFTACDLSPRRIAHARDVAEKLSIDNVSFHHADAVQFVRDLPPQQAIYMFDLVHHLPPAEVDDYIRMCWDKLAPGGILIIKDVNDRPWLKMAFTWILDVLVTRGERPHYRSDEFFVALLSSLSDDVTAHNLDDYLPYPHMLYTARKRKTPA